MLPLQQIALIKEISTREVYRLIEKGEIQYIETDGKEVFVCSDFEHNVALVENFKETK